MRILTGKNQVITYILGLFLVVMSCLSVSYASISFGLSEELDSDARKGQARGLWDDVEDFDAIVLALPASLELGTYSLELVPRVTGLFLVPKIRLQHCLLDIPPPGIA